ncbi:MAG: FMN-dependent NADH-azoreductase [Alphaproteobacteria bacterium]|nr:FMN-dependent NADH-azoreductase [Alphaproteobacteria bacterium]
MNILHIDSSPMEAGSVSRQLTAAVVATWRRADPSVSVVHRDLAAAPPDHLSADVLAVLRGGKRDGLTARQAAELALTDTLIDELFAADAIVIGAPMYNFSVPTQLKAWIDRIAQAGRTFRYGETGPVGLVGGKKAVIVSSRGGLYAGKVHEQALDHQEAYLRAVLGFLGITDVEVVRSEGLNMGPEARAHGIDAARAQIDALVLPAAA